MNSLFKNSKILLPIIFGLLFLTGCKDKEAQEAVGFLIGFFIFLGGTIFTGIPAIVLSAVSISNRKTWIIALAIIFTFLYSIFLIAELNIFMEAAYEADKNTIIIFPAITFIIIILCIVMIVTGFKRSASNLVSKNSKSKNDALDQIIEGEDQI